MSGVFNAAFLIPVYNHGDTLEVTLRALARARLPMLVVDDGSTAGHREHIAAACARLSDCSVDEAEAEAEVTLCRHTHNRGKGAAVQTGLRELAARGFTHAFQVDADLQHDLGRAIAFLSRARAEPDRIVLGEAIFDASAPAVRRIGRYLTHVWVWINTLSMEIRDSMCGFRIYPVACVVSLIDQYRMGERMQFDTEVLVRWAWHGGRFATMAVATRYPEGGRSHFRLLRDNLLISAMHAKLFFGMLARLPAMLRRTRPDRPRARCDG